VKAIRYALILTALELAVCVFSNFDLGVFIPSSLLILVPFAAFNLLAAETLPENWAPGVIVFLSVVFLGALDIITSYQVVWIASTADETNAAMRSILGNPLTFTALKMGVDTLSAGIVYALIMMGSIGRGKSDFMKKAGLIAGIALVMFMTLPPVNNFVVLQMA